jgi:hypothetical protein
MSVQFRKSKEFQEAERYWLIYFRRRREIISIHQGYNDEGDDLGHEEGPNPDYIHWDDVPLFCRILEKKLKYIEFEDEPYHIKRWYWKNKPELLKLLGIQEFKPFIYLTISPGWKETGNLENSEARGNMLNGFIQGWITISDRWSKVDWVIEDGSQGNHIHSHIVLQINDEMRKSVETSYYKGNISSSIKKMWAKDVVMIKNELNHVLEGKFSIKGNILRKKEQLEDKMNYLEEELKPLDHRNLGGFRRRSTWELDPN